jgi:AcrR family transcriptional regulator
VTSQDAARPTVLRRDAARNRRRILEAARGLMTDGKPLQLNLVAQHAGVGVATVYRHFPTADALTEALAAEQISLLIAKVESAPRTMQGLRCFLKTALTLFMRDSTPARALLDPVTDDIRTQRRRLAYGLRALVTGIVAADPSVSPMLGPTDLMLMLCGAGTAIRHAPDRGDPALPDRYLSALLVGLLPRRSRNGVTVH